MTRRIVRTAAPLPTLPAHDSSAQKRARIVERIICGPQQRSRRTGARRLRNHASYSTHTEFVHPTGVFRSDCPDRRTSFPPCARGVRRPLPRRAQSPRAGQRFDSRPTNDGYARPDPPTGATGWTTQLLRTRRMSDHTTRGDGPIEWWDTTRRSIACSEFPAVVLRRDVQ